MLPRHSTQQQCSVKQHRNDCPEMCIAWETLSPQCSYSSSSTLSRCVSLLSQLPFRPYITIYRAGRCWVSRTRSRLPSSQSPRKAQTWAGATGAPSPPAAMPGAATPLCLLLPAGIPAAAAPSPHSYQKNKTRKHITVRNSIP